MSLNENYLNFVSVLKIQVLDDIAIGSMPDSDSDLMICEDLDAEDVEDILDSEINPDFNEARFFQEDFENPHGNLAVPMEDEVLRNHGMCYSR